LSVFLKHTVFEHVKAIL